MQKKAGVIDPGLSESKKAYRMTRVGTVGVAESFSIGGLVIIGPAVGGAGEPMTGAPIIGAPMAGAPLP